MIKMDGLSDIGITSGFAGEGAFSGVFSDCRFRKDMIPAEF
jgi:hypothetical protein